MWSDEEFRKRVAERCKELGLSQRSVVKTASVSHDFLQTTPAHGRRIDTLEKIGEALDWSLPQVLGIKVSGRIEIELADMTFAISDKVLRYRTPTRRARARMFARIYNILDARQREGLPNDQPYRDLLADAFAEVEATEDREEQPLPPANQL